MGCLGRLVSTSDGHLSATAREERCGCEWYPCVNVSCGGEECQSSTHFHKTKLGALERSGSIGQGSML